MVIIGLGVVGFYFFPQKEEYRATNMEVLEKEVRVIEDALTKRIEDAQNASSTEIEALAEKAYEDKKSLMLDEIEIRIRKEYESELEAERIELEKKVGSY